MAEYNVALAGVVVANPGTDDDVVESVAVDVPGPRHREARPVAGVDARQTEAGAAIEARKREIRAPPRGLAEHHVALAGSAAGGIGGPGPDDQVAEAVAVDIAGSRHRRARLIRGGSTVDAEAGAAVQRRQRQARGPPRGLAEDHEALADGIVAALRPDDQVGKSVAVDVAGGADRIAAEVVGVDAVEAEAVGAVEVAEAQRAGLGDAGLRDVGIDQQRRLALAVANVVFAADRRGAAPEPARAGVDGVAGIARDGQGVRGVRQAQHLGQVERQGVVARACEVDLLDAPHPGVGDGGQIEGEAGAVEPQAVIAAAAVDPQEARVGDVQAVDAGAAIKHVGAARPRQLIGAYAADHDVGAAGAAQRAAGADGLVRYRVGEVPTEDDVADAHVGIAADVGGGSADREVLETIAVDVAGAADDAAKNAVAAIHTQVGCGETSGSVEVGQINAAR